MPEQAPQLTRVQRVIFFCIAVLALLTFVFGILQFVNLRDDPAVSPSKSSTNAPDPAGAAGR